MSQPSQKMLKYSYVLFWVELHKTLPTILSFSKELLLSCTSGLRKVTLVDVQRPNEVRDIATESSDGWKKHISGDFWKPRGLYETDLVCILIWQRVKNSCYLLMCQLM